MRGFININKDASKTSNDVVVMVRGAIRKATGVKEKVGHLGTLDPLATGVLPIAVGNATRLFDFMAFKKKIYIATFVFGKETDTLDKLGKVTKESDKIPTIDEIKSVLPNFIGKISQVPPQFSAKNFNGRKAYKYARSGVDIDLPPKEVEIFDIELLSSLDNEFKFKIVCGGGTYIRSLVRDMAHMLGTVGIMTELQRTKSGSFELSDAIDFKDFEKDPLKYITPIETTLNHVEKVELNDLDFKHFVDGLLVKLDREFENNTFFVTRHGEVFSLCELDEEKNIRPLRRL